LQPIYPGLVPLGELLNDILFDLLWISTRIYRVHGDTQPVEPHVSRGGTQLFARNEHHLVFSTMKFVSNNEVVPITLQRGAGFWNQ
jgi:hypothetical protein